VSVVAAVHEQGGFQPVKEGGRDGRRGRRQEEERKEEKKEVVVF
jgi:hypothetical protein